MLGEPDHGARQSQAGGLEVQPPPGRDSCTARSPHREGSKRRRGRESTACQETRAGSGDAAGELGRASPRCHPGGAGSPRRHLGYSGS